jgi:hypothetical protein
MEITLDKHAHGRRIVASKTSAETDGRNLVPWTALLAASQR